MPIVTTGNGSRVWYSRQGTGQPLLHIHGSSFGHRNFERLTPLLTSSFEVIDFDLPGYGESSPGPARPATLETFADEAAGLVKAIGLEKVHVHGTSLGALVALILAVRHRELVDRLVLSCFMARYDQAARVCRQTWKRAAIDSGMDAVADLTAVVGFSRGYFERPEAPQQLQRMREAFARNLPEAFVASTEALEATDLSDLPEQVLAPTLLLAGSEDNMTPFECGASGVGMADVHRSLRSSELVVLPDCGHYLVIEQPERAAEHIVRFLAPH